MKKYSIPDINAFTLGYLCSSLNSPEKISYDRNLLKGFIWATKNVQGNEAD